MTRHILLMLVLLASVSIVAIHEARRAARTEKELRALEDLQRSLSNEVNQLRHERDETAGKLSAVIADNSQLRQAVAELPKLRGQVTELRGNQHTPSNEPEPSETPLARSLLALERRAVELSQHLAQMPQSSIPELQFLGEADWLEVAMQATFESDDSTRKALSKLRMLAKKRFGYLLSAALQKYLQASNGNLPSDPLALKPYFEVSIDDSVLQRYEMLHTGNVQELPKDALVISEKAPIDPAYDSHLYAGLGGLSSLVSGKADPDKTWTARSPHPSPR